MASVVVIIVLIALIVGRVMYGNWLKKGIEKRTLTTKLPPADVREVFETKVATNSWKIVDDGNPMVAQSSLITGIRQQIALEITASDDSGTSVRFGAMRWVTKWGVPKKAHTIRLRMNSFEQELRRRDSSIPARS